MPPISVIMPVFNASRYLRDSVGSVLAQSFQNYELILIDDGSTDDSLSILREFERMDDRIRLISRPNTGLVGALNDGLSVVSSEIVARMDADDVSVSCRFEKQFAYLNANPHVIGVSGAVRYIDDTGLPIYDFTPPLASSEIADRLRKGCGEAFLHGAAMLRKQVLLDAGGYRTECEHVEDVDLFLRMLEFGELGNLPEVMLHYRMHEQSVCHRHSDVQADRLQSLLGLERAKPPKSRSISFRENLAFTALRAGNMRTARANALKDLRSRPYCWRSVLIYFAALVGFGKKRESC